MDLVVLVDEDDAVGLGVGPPFVEPARRVAPVPPAVLVDGVLERLALLVHLAVPVLLGALDEGEDRVRLGRLGEGREGRDDHVAVGLEAVRRLEVLVGEAHVLVLDRRWRWRHVAQVVAAVVPVDVVEEALEPFGELVGEGDAGLAERAVRARAVVVGEDEEDDEGGEEERPDDSGPLPQGDACSCSCAAAAAAWPPRVPPGRADHGRVGLDIVREGRRRRGAHGGCALAGTTTRARGQVERVVLLGRRRRVGRRERGRGGSRAVRGGRCAWWCGGRGRGEGERARRRLGRVVVRGGRAGSRGRVQRGRGPRVRRGQDRSQLGQCAGGWHGQCSGWTRRRRRRRRNSISRSRRARTRASLENSSRLFPLARSHKYCIDGEARLKVQSTTQRDRETTSPAGAHREGGHRNQGEQLVEEERGYRKGAWRGLLLGRVEGRGQRRGWYREARGCGEWCDERGRGDAEGGCEARWCGLAGDARLTSEGRT